MPYPTYTVTFNSKDKTKAVIRDVETRLPKTDPFETPGPHTLVWESGTSKVTIELSHRQDPGDEEPTLIITLS